MTSLPWDPLGAAMPSSAQSPDPDEGKPRVTVRQLAALIGEEVASRLEGLARARREKHPRAYQTDEEIHQSFSSATTGGADQPSDEADADSMPHAAPSGIREVFPLVRYDYDAEEMRGILDFENKRRPTPTLKELLKMPCMKEKPDIGERTEEMDRRKSEQVLAQKNTQLS